LCWTNVVDQIDQLVDAMASLVQRDLPRRLGARHSGGKEDVVNGWLELSMANS
jgi:hypothetical protein